MSTDVRMLMKKKLRIVSQKRMYFRKWKGDLGANTSDRTSWKKY